MDWYFKVLRNYIGFGGRARRKEYWMFVLVSFILGGVLGILDNMFKLSIRGDNGMLTTLYSIAIFLPTWAVTFRRLHDTDRSAWWLLLLIIPFIGFVVTLIFTCQRGTAGPNRFGPDPIVEPTPTD